MRKSVIKDLTESTIARAGQSCATGTLADEDQRRMMLIKSVGHSSYLLYFAQLYTSTPSSDLGQVCSLSDNIKIRKCHKIF